MPALLTLSTMAGIALLMALAVRAQKLHRRGALRALASALGLSWRPGGFWSADETVLTGQLRRFQVAASLVSRNDVESLRFTIDSAGRDAGAIPPTLLLERQRSPLRLFGGDDAITGDAAFDAAVHVGCNDVTALAALGPQARRAFLGLLERVAFLQVVDGCAIFEIPADTSIDEATRLVHSALALAESLSLAADGIEAALASRAAEDPLPGVRAHAFAALAAGEWRPGLVAGTARKLLDDPHPELRLRAAIALDDEGFEHLARLVRTPAAPDPPGGVKKFWWEITLPGGGATDESLLDTAEAQERRRGRALLHLALRQRPELVLPLLKEALRARGPLLVAALEALAALGAGSCEGEAIAALGSGIAEVRRAAVGALGAIGTAAAIPPLRALADERSAGRALRGAIDAAVSRIQARLPGAAAGQVTLADEVSGSGRLSIAQESAHGRLSRPEDDALPP